MIDGENVIVPDSTKLLAFRGSIAHNLYVPKTAPKAIDDIDLMGFCVGTKENYFGLTPVLGNGTKEIVQGHWDIVLYDAHKAIALLLKGNPNILSILWTSPNHILRLGAFIKLIEHRDIFLGKHIYHAFAGYANSQLVKMTSRDPAELREYIGVTNELKRRGAHPNTKTPQDIICNEAYTKWSTEKLLARLRHYTKKGENLGYLGDKRKQLVIEHGFDAKNAAHLIRLLKMCKELFTDGKMHVYRTEDRQELLDIKAGKWKLEEIKNYAEQLFIEAKQAKDRSAMPEGPDAVKASSLLVEIIESYV